MKLFLMGICISGLLNGCYLQKTVYQDVNSSKKIVFPKDRKVFGRIIGGEIVSPYVYPFQVIIWTYYKNGVSRCGGSLISTLWVLTAGHCLDEEAEYAVIIMGDVMLSKTTTKPTTVALVSDTFVFHEEYYRTEYGVSNDIALVKLPRSVPINQYIGTVAYTKGYDSYENSTSIALGWGRTRSGKSSHILRKVRSQILSNSRCGELFPYTVIGPEHLCTSGEGNVASCKGDSGGPLLVNEVQVGISSFGAPTCGWGEPSVFTRVSYYADWIETYAVDGSDTYRNLHYLIVILVLYYLLKHVHEVIF